MYSQQSDANTPRTFAELPPADMCRLLVSATEVLEELLRGGAGGPTSAQRLLRANQLLDRLHGMGTYRNPQTNTALSYGAAAAHALALISTQHGDHAVADEWRAKLTYINAALLKWGGTMDPATGAPDAPVTVELVP